jgi:hypothetical protein
MNGCFVKLFLNSSKAPDYSEGKQQYSANNFEDQLDSKAGNFKREQEQPHQGKQKQHEQRQWPAAKKQKAPKNQGYESSHRGSIWYHPSNSLPIQNLGIQ